MRKFLSVIIPTYNMEKYLRRCLDSLIIDKKYMSLYEVLIINDGSKDSSSLIAHEYEELYPETFRVIDKENGNYGSCINKGIDEAIGIFFKILDADDWYDKEAFKRLIEGTLEYYDKVDVLFSNFSYHNYNTGEISIYKFTTIEYEKIYKLRDIPLAFSIDEFLLKMYCVTIKTKILKDIKLRLDTGISYTDNEYMYFPYPHIGNVCFLNTNVYQYFIGREGQTIKAIITEKHLDDVLIIANRIVDDYNNNVMQFINNKHIFDVVTNMVVQRCTAYFDQALSTKKNPKLTKKIVGLYKKIKGNKVLLRLVRSQSKAFKLWECTRLYKSNTIVRILFKIINKTKNI